MFIVKRAALTTSAESVARAILVPHVKDVQLQAPKECMIDITTTSVFVNNRVQVSLTVSAFHTRPCKARTALCQYSHDWLVHLKATNTCFSCTKYSF